MQTVLSTEVTNFTPNSELSLILNLFVQPHIMHEHWTPPSHHPPNICTCRFQPYAMLNIPFLANGNIIFHNRSFFVENYFPFPLTSSPWCCVVLIICLKTKVCLLWFEKQSILHGGGRKLRRGLRRGVGKRDEESERWSMFICTTLNHQAFAFIAFEMAKSDSSIE